VILLEYQAKELLKQRGLDIPRGDVAKSVEEARVIAEKIGGHSWAIKPQLFGIKTARSPYVFRARSLVEVEEFAGRLFSQDFLSKHFGEEFTVLKEVIVEEWVEVINEFTLGFHIDRKTGGILCKATKRSRIGDVLDKELVENEVNSEEHSGEVTEETEVSTDDLVEVEVFLEASHQVLPLFIARKIAYAMGIQDVQLIDNFYDCLNIIYQFFLDFDCLKLELDPVGLAEGQGFRVLDAKLSIDRTALYRQESLHRFCGQSDYCVDRFTQEACAADLDVIKMDGNIAALVNGTGLALATIDMLSAAGGSPGAMIDIGSNTSEESLTQAIRLLTSDESSEVLLVNIFGGITRCDWVARVLANVFEEKAFSIPVIVRLEGSSMSIGKKILIDAGMKPIFAQDLDDVVQKAVSASLGDLDSLEDDSKAKKERDEKVKGLKTKNKELLKAKSSLVAARPKGESK